MEKTITITEKEYNELQGYSFRLAYLEGAGVDNWDGYGDASEQWEADGMEEDYGRF